ncbi:hypothetical protein COB21_04830 [Candidatus Aerophobetes bacterium]|uniref:Uncharacterized protein n=1 Tax=Aerophobetes bacterium TaxID=2030807 RepID=A0A2A4X1X7_UNCAE|nr:MAG: hypothetical protein COB21_04830 [Candidatus Aerophobetes bacterium]
MRKRENVLCISFAVGGGHTQAAKERIKQLRKNCADIHIIEKDLIVDLVNPLFGKIVHKFLNLALKKRWVRIRNLIFSGQPLADQVVLFPSVFIATLITLIKHDIDKVISTQPVGILAMSKAILVAEKFLKKEISFELVIPELPTAKAVSFFTPIQRLKPFYKKRLLLTSVHPYCEFGKTDAEFWMQNCGIDSKQVSYAHFPVRSEFLLPDNQAISREKTQSLSLQFKAKEFESLMPFYKKDTVTLNRDKQSISVNISPSTILTTIMLGSRPLEKTLLNYARSFVKAVPENNLPYNHCIILICSDTASIISPAFTKLKKALKNLPSVAKLTILPIPFQEASTLAPLILRSDATITCSGGMTSIELMQFARGKIWIHSDFLDKTWKSASSREMPIWEIGNAEYLIHKRQAVIINPRSLQSEYMKLVTDINQQA